MWAYIVVALIAIIAAVALAPKPTQPKPPELSDLDVPTAEEGRAIPVIFGTVTITGGNVVWYGDLRYDAVKTKGGK